MVYQRGVMYNYGDYQDANAITRILMSFQMNYNAQKIRLYFSGETFYKNESVSFFDMRSISTQNWYLLLVNSEENLKWFPSQYFRYESTVGMKEISLARKIWSMDGTRQLVGILRIDIPEEDISHLLANANILNKGSTFMANSSGELICSTGEYPKMNPSHLYNKIPYTEILSPIYKKIHEGNEDFLASYISVKDTDWMLLTVVPYSEIHKAGRDARNFMMIVMLITCLVAYFFAYIISTSMTKRIHSLSKIMENAQKENYNVVITQKGNDEIGSLMQNLGKMISTISEYSKRQFEMGKELKSAELKALQSQINPHFLYNSLDVINWHASMNGITEIEDMVHALTRFYKLNLRKGEDIVTLENEIEHVKAFVEIQNIRLDNSILLVIHIEDAIRNFKVPKIILQPIVENCIIHGILERKPKTGTITIEGKIAEDIVLIEITDDGAGIPEEMLVLMNQAVFHSKTSGYGLKNIGERLHVFLGNKAQLTFFSKLYHGTTVRIELPIHQQNYCI